MVVPSANRVGMGGQRAGLEPTGEGGNLFSGPLIENDEGAVVTGGVSFGGVGPDNVSSIRLGRNIDCESGNGGSSRVRHVGDVFLDVALAQPFCREALIQAARSKRLDVRRRVLLV